MNNKLWAGRFSKELNKVADDFNSSIPFDSRMYLQDIRGSIAHATMLGMQGIITIEEAQTIINELANIEEDITEGRLSIDMSAEDIHMFVETVLTERIGDVGKKLHTARSRNDQVVVDIRLWLKDETDAIIENICSLIEALTDKADEYKEAIMPGYTHMQRAQPITFGHHLMAYVSMFTRDIERLSDACARMMSSCPLGSCALAGTTYNTDRQRTADILGFQYPCRNSLDGVSDRDFAVELCAAYSLVMMHISRLSEEIILWSSWEFKFIELDDSFSTGSSIMPQKKNPDMAELARGKTGRVYGDLMTLLTVMKGTPLAYNKDMQEDKEAIFDAVDTLKACLGVFAPMIATMRPIPENMYSAAQKGFINATDVADYLVGKGLPFRSAYKITGQLVGKCVAEGKVLDNLALEEYREFSELFDDDLYGYISLESCVSRRTSYGGTSPESVASQISYARDFLDAFKEDED
ncbi:MAG: argininosuccinate lyase [Clostridia bacterium]|nr:argininosuccinate lyase [Clostridia bacterium]